MTDYIDRQAAIDAIERLILPQTKGETAAEEINRVAWRCAINCAEEVIGHMPSADVEPVKRGKWIDAIYDMEFCFAECDQCHNKAIGVGEYTGNSFDYRFPRYCPNCGAKMGAEEG